jgi:hypothetical protein
MDCSAADVPVELESLSDSGLADLLEGAEDEERSMSYQRRMLHARIDATEAERSSGGADGAVLVALLQEERALSDVRLQLHHWITELRLERARRLGPVQPRLRRADAV